MLKLSVPMIGLYDQRSRREILRIGGSALLGAGLGTSVARLANAEGPAATDTSFGQAKACIILFLLGGPPQHSTWDPKPDTPPEIRGEFAPIATRVPGLSICELWPNMARVADKVCLLRAMSTGDYSHASSGYYMLTGCPHQPKNIESGKAGPPNDSPSLASLIGRLGSTQTGLPPALALPERIYNDGGQVWSGQDGGFLGRAYDPWLLNARMTPEGYQIREIALPDDLGPDRLDRRRNLLQASHHDLGALDSDPAARLLHGYRQQAFELLQSMQARRAFRVDLEPEAVRERYGKTPFGQSVHLARRLVEAGARVVQVNWQRAEYEPPGSPCWDSHRREADKLKNVLVPPTDQAFATLLADLEERGLLKDTVVLCTGEFGRSPRFEQDGGRGHWGGVFSAVLAGGGIKGGQVYGSSDRIGGYPRDGLVRPEDLSATLLHCMGHDPATEIRDPLGRPFPLSRGEVVRAIL